MKKWYFQNACKITFLFTSLFTKFVTLYRLKPHLVLELINILSDQITVQRISAIPVHLQILAVLRFLADGAFQKGVASDFNHPMSQASLSRCFDRVVNALNQLKDNYVQFPKTRAKREEVSNK